MPYVVFGALAAARNFRDAIDVEFGYPLPNVLAPGGIHGPLGQTVRFATLLKHPTQNRWAFPDEPVVRGKRPQVPLPGGATTEELDGTWEDAEEASFM